MIIYIQAKCTAPEAKSWDFGEHSRVNVFTGVKNNQLWLHYFVKQEINVRGVET